MIGKEPWPESHHFIEDASPTMECVRLALSIINDHGEKQLHNQESGLLEFRETDVVYGDGTLQLRQIPSMILPDESSHEQNRIESGSTINSEYDGAPPVKRSRASTVPRHINYARAPGIREY